MKQKKSPKESASKNKKISITKFFIFFRSRDANFSLWSQTFDWTFINVQFWILEKGFGVKNRIFAMWGP